MSSEEDDSVNEFVEVSIPSDLVTRVPKSETEVGLQTEMAIKEERTPSETDGSTDVENEEYTIGVNQSVNFRQYLHHHLEQNSLSDLEIHIRDHIYKCHRSVLEIYSSYIRERRPLNKSIVLPAEAVTPEAFKIIYDWMLKPQFKLKRTKILEVYIAAKFLHIDELVDQSWFCFTAPMISEDRAFLLYLEAIFYELPKVQTLMLTRVKKFFLTMVGYMQFVELPFTHVCELLASDSIGVNCELEVFFACVRYLSSHWEERKERVFEMLRNVRFGLLPPHVLVSFRFKREAPEINRLLENVRVEKLLSQTMHFSIGLGTPPTGSLLFKERQWIYDVDCDYHSTKNFAGRARLTYEKFLEYVNYLAKTETHWQRLEKMDDVERAMQILGSP